MSFLLALLVIIVLSLSVSYIFRKKFEYTLPATTATISLILYIFSFINARSTGINLTLIIAAVAVVYLIYKLIKEHGHISDLFKSSGLISFLLIAIVICIIARGFVFSSWDEFSHWGLVLKNMYLTNNFGNLSNSTTIFKFYPPGISLFLNFATSFSVHFSEASALGGILTLSYAQLMIIFTKIKHNDWKKILLITGIIFIAPLVFFANFYNTIMVDAVVALIFANILYFNFSYEKKDVFYAIYMSLQFYLLVSSKQIGIGFALIAFVAIFIDFIITNWERSIKLFFINLKIKLAYIVIPLITGVLTYSSWKIYIKSHGINEGNLSPTLSKLLNSFGPTAPSYYKLVTNNFVHHFFTIQTYVSISLSPFLWSIILGFTMYLVYRLDTSNKRTSFSFQLLTILGLYLYSAAILFMYLIGFSEYEAYYLGGVDRYLGTYFMGMLILVIFIIISYMIKSRPGRFSRNTKIACIYIILLCLIPANGIVDNTLFHKTTNDTRHAFREPYENAKSYSSLMDPNKDRIYVISQNSGGQDYYMLRYNFTPVQVQGQYSFLPTGVRGRTWMTLWSLGKPYSPEDQWTTDITADQWSKALKSFTYVYLYKIDDRFINDYGQLFDDTNNIKNATMYRVEKINNSVALKPTTVDDMKAHIK